MSTPLRRELAGYALGLAGVVMFGATLPATRIAVAVIDPWFVTMGRAALATIAAALALALTRRSLPERRHMRPLAIAALCLVFGFPGFANIAMVTVPAAHGGVVLGILPISTAVCAVLVAGERPSAAFWLLSGIGAALVIAYTLKDGGMTISAGDLWLLAAAASASFGYALSGTLSREMPGWVVISWALLLAAPVSFAATAFLWQPVYLDAPVESWFAFAYLGLFSMFLGFVAWNTGLALGGVARVGQVQLLQTFVTIAIAALLLAEEIDGATLIFAVAIVVVVALTRRAQVTTRR
ncbi:MAG: DMT family transporter [Hyphomicrobiales bacterium]|nr:DMT family transporter [Hyphomicrobiales bacterium]